jgi:hypothetical protein
VRFGMYSAARQRSVDTVENKSVQIDYGFAADYDITVALFQDCDSVVDALLLSAITWRERAAAASPTPSTTVVTRLLLTNTAEYVP